ncbi:MAG: 3'-phosphoesterase [Deltaproteobacteria bacterium]|nr:3'-phosphoesterase [Deltaproteobacteria bacterium]
MSHQEKFRFVVHEHHARQLHYDLRLEINGVLKSWALPKGPSMNPSEKRLAILVKDHPLDYAGFEGIIPAGLSGAGPVVVWDEGQYAVVAERHPRDAFRAGKMVLELFGRTLKGGFTLFRMKGRGPENWLFVKRKDAYSRPAWRLEMVLTEQRRAELTERVPPCDTS